MSFREPALSHSFANPGGRTTQNPAEGRWRWWYSSIADWMIRNPDKPLRDCAKELNKAPQTIYMIVNTDLFKTYLQKRKESYASDHDFMLRSKLTDVASESLDIVLEKLKAKKDQIPMTTLVELTTGALDRLGYAPKATPAVNVNLQQNDNRTQIAVVGVTPAALEEAREALRRAEQLHRPEPTSELLPPLEAAEPRSDVAAIPPAVESDVEDGLETGEMRDPFTLDS